MKLFIQADIVTAHFLEGSKITALVIAGRTVRNDNVTVIDQRIQTDRLVDGIFPGKVSDSAVKLGTEFPVIIVNRIVGQLIVVIHLDNIDFRDQPLFQH